jgi:hypothetical protein
VENDQGSGDKIIVDLARAHLLRRCGLKITPALREYYRYTGISAEVEQHGLGHSDDTRYQVPPASDRSEQRTHE